MDISPAPRDGPGFACVACAGSDLPHTCSRYRAPSSVQGDTPATPYVSRCVVCGRPGAEHENGRWCLSDQLVTGEWPTGKAAASTQTEGA